MYYGLNKYGQSNYAENIPSTEELIDNGYFVDLTKYVPTVVWKKSDIIKGEYKTQGLELGLLYYYLEDLKNQLFIDTATWGLVFWEEEYGIPTNLNYSYEERREIIKARKRGQGTCTKALIKNVAEAFSGGECNVLENTAPYTFTIQFVGVKGIPRNMQGLKEAINDIKPAHMLYGFKYTYTNWDYLDNKNLSYNNAELLTWDEIEIID